MRAWAGAAGDGGDDGECIGRLGGGGLFFREVADVFIVQVEVDEGAELAVVREEVALELGVRAGELVEGGGDGGRVDLHRGLLCGERA